MAGIRLELSDGREPLTALGDIDVALAGTGCRAWPLDLTGAPAPIRRLLARPRVTTDEAARLQAHFLLPRERLLATIEAAGRTPNVPGGGALTTSVSNQGYSYPQLWVVQGGVDYTRFDRFHVNVSDDGVGVDEVLQIVSGGGVVIRQRSPGCATLALRLDCPAPETGWLVTYDGGRPHVGSLSAARPGTKVVVQAIGPPRWALRYEGAE
jgi:hypothetical protein